MLERFAYAFNDFAEGLTKVGMSLELELVNGDKMLDTARVQTLFEMPIKWCRKFTAQLPLPSVKAHIQRIESEVKYPLALSRAKELLGGLNERMNDDLRNCWFLHVQADNAELFLNPLAGWGDAVAKFASATHDMEEAVKCLTLERGTATVFHLMRTLERGLRALADDLGLTLPDQPNWGETLDLIEKRVVKQMPPSDPKAAHRNFYQAAVMQFRLFKDAVRNYTIHESVEYNPSQATGHYRAVTDFMRHLATRISE